MAEMKKARYRVAIPRSELETYLDGEGNMRYRLVHTKTREVLKEGMFMTKEEAARQLAAEKPLFVRVHYRGKLEPILNFADQFEKKYHLDLGYTYGGSSRTLAWEDPGTPDAREKLLTAVKAEVEKRGWKAYRVRDHIDVYSDL